MFKSIRIRNFQSHKHTFIKLNKGVNVIVGNSDHGKSAIIRAVRWVTDNRPSGIAYRSHWGGVTKVEIEKVDGTLISKVRSKTKNFYRISSPENDVQIYKGFNQQVPEEVKAALNMSSINIQNQLDMPFLLSNSPGDVARYLNSLVDLDVIDRAVSSINSKASRTSSETKSEKARLTELQEELDNYTGLDELESIIIQAEITTGKIKKNKDNIIALSNILNSIKEIKDTAKEEAIVDTADELAQKAASIIRALPEKQQDITTLSAIINDVTNINKKIKVDKPKLAKCRKELNKILDKKCPLCGHHG